MTHRPVPAALRPRKPNPKPIIVYIAVPHPKLLDALRKAHIFMSASVDRRVELRAFQATDLPPDAIRLLGNLTEIGEVVDQPLEIIHPEPMP